MKTRRKRPAKSRSSKDLRFTMRRRIGKWVLLYDEEASSSYVGGVIKDRWYVIDLRTRVGDRGPILGPYFKGTAEAVFEALIKVMP